MLSQWSAAALQVEARQGVAIPDDGPAVSVEVNLQGQVLVVAYGPTPRLCSCFTSGGRRRYGRCARAHWAAALVTPPGLPLILVSDRAPNSWQADDAGYDAFVREILEAWRELRALVACVCVAWARGKSQGYSSSAYVAYCSRPTDYGCVGMTSLHPDEHDVGNNMDVLGVPGRWVAH